MAGIAVCTHLEAAAHVYDSRPGRRGRQATQRGLVQASARRIHDDHVALCERLCVHALGQGAHLHAGHSLLSQGRQRAHPCGEGRGGRADALNRQHVGERRADVCQIQRN